MKAVKDLKVLTLVALAGVSLPSFAQDALLEQTDEILNSEQIDIDGSFRRESAADRVAKMRKKLEEQNSQMVQKKIEDIRIKQEQELAGKLKDAFQGNLEANRAKLGELDSVETIQAAPQRVVAPMPEVEVEEEKQFKITPYVGGKLYDAKGIESFSTDIDTGIRFDAMVTDYVSIGLSFNYTSLKFNDDQDAVKYYFDEYSDGVDFKYKNLQFGVNSKFYFTKSRFRPYVGLGAAYNRSTLSIDETVRSNYSYTYYNNYYGYSNYNNLEENDLEVSGGNFTGTAAVGAEFLINDSIGVNVEGSFTRAFNSAYNASSTYSTSGERVENYIESFGERFDDANIAALNIGLLVRF